MNEVCASYLTGSPKRRAVRAAVLPIKPISPGADKAAVAYFGTAILPGDWEDFSVRIDQNALTIEVLIKKLQDADQVVRLHAATLVGAMGDDAESAVPALIRMLQADNIHDRKLAALTLGEIGPAAEEALPALFAAAEDEDEGLAEMALWAFEEIDLVDEEAEAA